MPPARMFARHELPAYAPTSVIPQCGSCGLYKGCKTPKMPHSGKGRKGILIVAEAPGEEEDKRGTQLIGKAGALLERHLDAVGIDMREDCFLTNALICRPKDNKIPDEKKMVDFCRPNLLNTIKAVNPSVIIPLGGVAVNSLIGWLWREDPGGITRWAGWNIPSQRLNAWICPTYHPSFVLREDEPALNLLFGRHLKAAVSHDSRPWNPLPNYESRVRVLTLDEASSVIRDIRNKTDLISFDYETDRLKPDAADSEIVAASVCDGQTSFAFHWHGPVIEEFKALLQDKRIGKIGYNIKFEDRWTRRALGVPVRNWVWDGMLAAHALDNRSKVTGLKFQAFARLGGENYDQHVKKFFDTGKDSGGNDKNRIHAVPSRDLLMYVGLDSLLEYDVALHQLKEMGIKSFDSGNTLGKCPTPAV